nr:transposase [Amycolatopsis arida]
MLCDVAPLPASSGRTTRHRLNRGDDRQANAALYRIVPCRLRWDPRTRAYAERRTKEGMSKKEIIRCRTRYTAREIYHALNPTPRPQQPHSTRFDIHRSITAGPRAVPAPRLRGGRGVRHGPSRVRPWAMSTRHHRRDPWSDARRAPRRRCVAFHPAPVRHAVASLVSRCHRRHPGA